MTNSQAEQFCRDNFTTRVSNRTTQYWTPDRVFTRWFPGMVNRVPADVCH